MTKQPHHDPDKTPRPQDSASAPASSADEAADKSAPPASFPAMIPNMSLDESDGEPSEMEAVENEIPLLEEIPYVTEAPDEEIPMARAAPPAPKSHADIPMAMAAPAEDEMPEEVYEGLVLADEELPVEEALPAEHVEKAESDVYLVDGMEEVPLAQNALSEGEEVESASDVLFVDDEVLENEVVPPHPMDSPVPKAMPPISGMVRESEEAEEEQPEQEVFSFEEEKPVGSSAIRIEPLTGDLIEGASSSRVLPKSGKSSSKMPDRPIETVPLADDEPVAATEPEENPFEQFKDEQVERTQPAEVAEAEFGSVEDAATDESHAEAALGHEEASKSDDASAAGAGAPAETEEMTESASGISLSDLFDETDAEKPADAVVESEDADEIEEEAVEVEAEAEDEELAVEEAAEAEPVSEVKPMEELQGEEELAEETPASAVVVDESALKEEAESSASDSDLVAEALFDEAAPASGIAPEEGALTEAAPALEIAAKEPVAEDAIEENAPTAPASAVAESADVLDEEIAEAVPASNVLADDDVVFDDDDLAEAMPASALQSAALASSVQEDEEIAEAVPASSVQAAADDVFDEDDIAEAAPASAQQPIAPASDLAADALFEEASAEEEEVAEAGAASAVLAGEETAEAAPASSVVADDDVVFDEHDVAEAAPASALHSVAPASDLAADALFEEANAETSPESALKADEEVLDEEIAEAESDSAVLADEEIAEAAPASSVAADDDVVFDEDDVAEEAPASALHSIAPASDLAADALFEEASAKEEEVAEAAPTSAVPAGEETAETAPASSVVADALFEEANAETAPESAVEADEEVLDEEIAEAESDSAVLADEEIAEAAPASSVAADDDVVFDEDDVAEAAPASALHSVAPASDLAADALFEEANAETAPESAVEADEEVLDEEIAEAESDSAVLADEEIAEAAPASSVAADDDVVFDEDDVAEAAPASALHSVAPASDLAADALFEEASAEEEEVAEAAPTSAVLAGEEIAEAAPASSVAADDDVLFDEDDIAEAAPASALHSVAPASDLAADALFEEANAEVAPESAVEADEEVLDEEIAEAESDSAVLADEEIAEAAPASSVAADDDVLFDEDDVAEAAPASEVVLGEENLDEEVAEAAPASEVLALEEVEDEEVAEAAPASEVFAAEEALDEDSEEAAPVSAVEEDSLFAEMAEPSSATRKAESVFDEDALDLAEKPIAKKRASSRPKKSISEDETESGTVLSDDLQSKKGKAGDRKKKDADQTIAFESLPSGSEKSSQPDSVVIDEDLLSGSDDSAVELGEISSRKGSSISSIDPVAEALESGVGIDVSKNTGSAEFDELYGDLDDSAETEIKPLGTKPVSQNDANGSTEMESGLLAEEDLSALEEPVLPSPSKKDARGKPGKKPSLAQTGDDVDLSELAEEAEASEVAEAEEDDTVSFDGEDVAEAEEEEAEVAEAEEDDAVSFDAEEDAEAEDAEAEDAEADEADVNSFDDEGFADAEDADAEDADAEDADAEDADAEDADAEDADAEDAEAEDAEAEVAFDEEEAAADALLDDDEVPAKKSKLKVSAKKGKKTTSFEEEDEELAPVPARKKKPTALDDEDEEIAEDDEETSGGKKKGKKDGSRKSKLAPVPVQSGGGKLVPMIIGMFLILMLIGGGGAGGWFFAPESVKQELAEAIYPPKPLPPQIKKGPEKDKLDLARADIAQGKFDEAAARLKDSADPKELSARGEAKWLGYFKQQTDKKADLDRNDPPVKEAVEDLTKAKNEVMLAQIDKTLSAKESNDKLQKFLDGQKEEKKEFDTTKLAKEKAEKLIDDAKNVLVEGKIVEKDFDVATLPKQLKELGASKTVLDDVNKLLKDAKIKGEGDEGVKEVLKVKKENEDKVAAVNKVLEEEKIKGQDAEGVTEIAKMRTEVVKDRDDLAATLAAAFKELVDGKIVPMSDEPRKQIVEGVKIARVKAESPLSIPLGQLGTTLGSIGTNTGKVVEQSFDMAKKFSELGYFHSREPFIQTPEQKMDTYISLLQNRKQNDVKEMAAIAKEIDWVRSEKSKADAEARAKALFVQGLAQRNQEKFEEAKKAIEESLKEIQPIEKVSWKKAAEKSQQELTDPDAYFVPRIKTFTSEKNWKAALREADLAIKAMPKEEGLLLLRGLVRYEKIHEEAMKDKDEIRKASADAEIAAKNDEKLVAESSYVLGLLEEEAGNLKEAEAKFRQAIKTHQGMPEALDRYRLALTNLLLRDREPVPVAPRPDNEKKKDADKDAFLAVPSERVIVMHPWTPMVVRATLAIQPAGEELEDPEMVAKLKEAADLAQLLIDSPNPKIKGQGYVNLGIVYAKRGRRTEGLKEISKGLKLLYPGRETSELIKMIEEHPAFQQPDVANNPNPEMAARHFGEGLHFYWSRQYPLAEAQFKQAVRYNNLDARYQYYLGLAQLGQKTKMKRDAAIFSFEQGARLEAKGSPPIRDINLSLERVQGELRQMLNNHRYNVLSPPPDGGN